MSEHREVYSRPLKIISVSQLDRSGFNSQGKESRCTRRYVFEKFYRLVPYEQSPAATWGNNVHTVLQRFALGLPPPAPTDPYLAIATPALQHVFDLSHRQPEQVFWEDLGDVLPGLRYKGLADLLGDREGAPVPQTTQDYKTTSQINGSYTIKTPKELTSDLQAALMGEHTMRQWGFTEVTLRWLYLSTDGFFDKFTGAAKPKMCWKPGMRKVESVLARDQSRQSHAVFKDDVSRLVKFIGEKKPWFEVEPDRSQCYSFGKPCPFMELCDGQQKWKDENMASIRELMEKRKAAAAALETPAAPEAVEEVEPVVDTPPPEAPPVIDLDNVPAPEVKPAEAMPPVGEAQEAPPPKKPKKKTAKKATPAAGTEAPAAVDALIRKMAKRQIDMYQSMIDVLVPFTEE